MCAYIYTHIYTCITELLCCAPKANTTQWIYYTSIKKKKMQCLKDTVSNGYIAGLKDEDEEFRRSIVVTEAYCECV